MFLLLSGGPSPRWSEASFGRIVNTASQVGQRGGAGTTHYAARKGRRSIGITKFARPELGGTG